MEVITVKEALERVIMEHNISKYRLAKDLDVTPIMIDKWLTQESKTMRKDSADRLKDKYDIEISPIFVNYRQKTMRITKDNELSYD